MNLASVLYNFVMFIMPNLFVQKYNLRKPCLAYHRHVLLLLKCHLCRIAIISVGHGKLLSSAQHVHAVQMVLLKGQATE